MFKNQRERKDLLDYIEDYLFDKEYTQCVVYFGDIVGETEFEKKRVFSYIVLLKGW